MNFSFFKAALLASTVIIYAEESISVTINPIVFLLNTQKNFKAYTGNFELKISEKSSLLLSPIYLKSELEDRYVKSITGVGGSFDYRKYLGYDYFSGAYFDLRLSYLSLEAEELEESSQKPFKSTGFGITMAPIVGYKYMSRNGFVLDFGIGYAYGVSDLSPDTTLYMSHVDHGAIVKALTGNAEIGWAF